MVIVGQIFEIPALLQVTRGDSAIRAGLIILPLFFIIIIFVTLVGQIVARTGSYRWSIWIGYAIWALGLGLLSTISATTSEAKIIGFLVITGIGQGGCLQTTIIAAQAACTRADMSTVTSTRNFLRSLGGAVVIALASAILNSTLELRRKFSILL